MPDPRNYQTEAIVIKKIKLGEADRILTLYTPGRGKIEAVAKGVRRPRSKLSGHLELLTYSQVRLARGRNLDTVIGSQAIDSFMPLKDDLWLSSLGLYATELVNQFTVEHVGNSPLFRLLLDTLRYLCRADNTELILRYFELHLLDLVGYRPQLRECVSCRMELQPIVNAFCSSAGGILCPTCRYEYPGSFSISVDALKVLRLFQRSTFEIVGQLKISQELSQELKTVLSSYIHYLLEREVRSATWMDTLRDYIGGGVK